jgi:hypothetical protein
VKRISTRRGEIERNKNDIGRRRRRRRRKKYE